MWLAHSVPESLMPLIKFKAFYVLWLIKLRVNRVLQKGELNSAASRMDTRPNYLGTHPRRKGTSVLLDGNYMEIFEVKLFARESSHLKWKEAQVISR